jgi:serine/threonine-protein kinase
MLKPGDPFERFTIEAAIGQGGMGCVYRAHDARLGRRVALKVISDGAQSAEANARLVREARAAAALDHPNAVAIFDVGELDGAPYIVMELCEGRTLRAVVGDAEVPVATRVSQLADVARALAGAHRRGLVHRDVKPENVMVRTDGVVKVLDFGIARRAGGGGDVDSDAITQAAALPTLTVEGVKLGTPVYMAPEQIRSETLDGRSDQFSWGVLAHELLTGRLPWRGGGDMFAVMASILTDPVDRAELDRAGVPPAVGDVVLRALKKRPEDRFASMDEAVKALEAAASGQSAPAPPPGATEAQRYSTGEVREVLGRAIEQQARQGSARLGFDDLLAVAEEMGVDPEALREASRAVRVRAEEQSGDLENARKRDAWIRRKRRAFHRHAGVYAIINGALLVLGLVLLSFTPWWIWFLPALGWGIGLAIHGLVALSANADDWAEHNEGMQWWLDRQKQRHEVALARAGEKGARRAAKDEEPRRRVEAVAAPEKVRVAALDTGRERAAEEEAALAEARDLKQRRG